MPNLKNSYVIYMTFLNSLSKIDSIDMSQFYNTVVYIETLRPGFRGKWLDVRRGTFEPISEREVIGVDTAKWLVKNVEGTNAVVLENMGFRNYYLAMHDTGFIECALSTYPFDNRALQWVLEKGGTQDIEGTYHMRTLDERFVARPYLNVDEQSGKYFYAKVVEEKASVRICHPDAVDEDKLIMEQDNRESSTEVEAKYNVKEGISQSESSESTVQFTTTIGFEIEQFFTLQASLMTEWKTVSSYTWEKEITKTYTFKVPAGKVKRVYQLTRTYGPFGVYSDKITYKESDE